MVEIKDRNSGETHRGRDVGSIARRVWGRRAEVHGRDGIAGDATRYMAEVIVPPTETQRRKNRDLASTIVARVVIDPDA